MSHLQLQSGFVLPPAFRLNRDVRPETDVMDEVLNRDAHSTAYNFWYSQEVSDLASLAAQKASVINDFEWQERLLKEYVKYFSGQGFINWVSMQLHSPYVSGYNIQYLDETLKWLVMCEPRVIKNAQWFRGLFPLKTGDGFNQQRPKIDLSTYVNGPFKCLDFEQQIRQLWLQRPDGIVELLGFMNNVFGMRNPNAPGFL